MWVMEDYWGATSTGGIAHAFNSPTVDLVFGGVLDHFLARETALARPDMPLLDRFFRA